MSNDLLSSSLWGVARGITVHTLIFPMEVVKIRQQCALPESNCIQVALTLFREEGLAAFYKGLAPQLVKTSLKQIWCWPMITGIPPLLKSYKIENLPGLALTGLSIATIDAAIGTPLERAKIISAFRGTSKFSLKNGWDGFSTNWSKLSVTWTAFLIAQKYLREQSIALSGGSLPLSQLVKIGVQVAFIVSLLSAPFDIANTLKQAQNISPSHLFTRNGIFKIYRGWPLSALSLIIHNIASVILIDRIGRS